MKIYYLKLDEELDEGLFEEFSHYVSKKEHEKVNNYHKYSDRVRTLLSRLVVKMIIHKMTDINHEEIVINEGRYGKPFIDMEQIHFNLSHSGRYIVVGFDNSRLGIDVEEIIPISENIPIRWFTESEINYVGCLHSSEEKWYEKFYEIWTLKESYIKADGRGLSIPINLVSFEVSGERIEMTTVLDFQECRFKLIEFDEKYKLAVCYTSESVINIEELKFDMVIKGIRDMCNY